MVKSAGNAYNTKVCRTLLHVFVSQPQNVSTPWYMMNAFITLLKVFFILNDFTFK